MLNKAKKDNFPRDNKKLELERTGPNYEDMFEICDLKLISEPF